MKKIIELVKYQLHIFFKGSKFVMPLVALAIFLLVLYAKTARPVGVVESFLITCYWVFLLMVWISLSVVSSESRIMEQIILLRVKSNMYYYLSKMLFLSILGLMINCICLIYPIVINLLYNGAVFERALTISDILNAFILLCGSAVVGSSLGSFLHPRVMKDRKMAIVLTVLFAVLTIVKTAVIKTFSIIKIISWILPPLDMATETYHGTDIFRMRESINIFLLLFLYALIVFVIKSYICHKRKF